MKIKEGFVLRDIGNQTVVVATGEASQDFLRDDKIESNW